MSDTVLSCPWNHFPRLISSTHDLHLDDVSMLAPIFIRPGLFFLSLVHQKTYSQSRGIGMNTKQLRLEKVSPSGKWTCEILTTLITLRYSYLQTTFSLFIVMFNRHFYQTCILYTCTLFSYSPSSMLKHRNMSPECKALELQKPCRRLSRTQGLVLGGPKDNTTRICNSI